MSWVDLKISVPGKWVLCGEHAVLRGATAIALPHPSYQLSLDFKRKRGHGIQIRPPEAEEVVREIFQALIDDWGAADRVFPMPEGELTVESTIPVGAGLGSSAALCVAL